MNSKLAKLLINPFEEISSTKLLIIGLLAYLASSVFVFYSKCHFEGLIGVKSGRNTNLALSFYNNGIAIVLLTLGCYIFSYLKKSNFRLIDIFNVVLISRIIIYALLLILIEPFIVKNTLLKVEMAILDDDFMLATLTNFDRTVLTIFGFLCISFIVYFFYFFITGLRFVINSKTKMDSIWILLIVFGLEIVFTLFHFNII